MDFVTFCKILPAGNCVTLHILCGAIVCSIQKTGDQSTFSTRLSTERIPNPRDFWGFSHFIHRPSALEYSFINRLWFIFVTRISNSVGFDATCRQIPSIFCPNLGLHPIQTRFPPPILPSICVIRMYICYKSISRICFLIIRNVVSLQKCTKVRNSCGTGAPLAAASPLLYTNFNCQTSAATAGRSGSAPPGRPPSCCRSPPRRSSRRCRCTAAWAA